MNPTVSREELAELRAALARRTTEWQDEQQARLVAEHARFAADQSAAILRRALAEYADRLENIATGRAVFVELAHEMRTVAALPAVAAGGDVPGAIVCGRGEPAPTSRPDQAQPGRVEVGQVYESCDPRGGPAIRVVEYTPGSNRAEVVDAVTGNLPRSILVTALHATRNTQAGRARRTGYRLVRDGSNGTAR
ncbi:hypothetical protein ACQEU6_08860 [Spirillospora sp. CA-108201]